MQRLSLTKASTHSRDAEAIRWQKSQTKTLLFADCRNPFEDVAIATRLRQVLHTHQGRDKMFKCIMYFLRIYMWMKNIKLNFMFIEGAADENFTLVERNYMTIMNSRRLFRLGRFVGEWVRIQVTLLKSSQLIYAPSNSRWMSYFVQMQMVLDVCARLLLCAKCLTDDLAYVSQKGFLHSAVAGKLLYIGARLAVPVMTSDLFLNSLNLAQRILDSRHVVTVRESPEFLAFYDQQRLAGQWHQIAAQQASASTHPAASFESLPLASADDFGELVSVGSRRQLLQGLTDAAKLRSSNSTQAPDTLTTKFLRGATAHDVMASNDSINMPPSEAATPMLKGLGGSRPHSFNDSEVPPMAIGKSTHTTATVHVLPRRHNSQAGAGAGASRAVSAGHNYSEGNSGSANHSRGARNHNRTSSAALVEVPTPVVLSATMENGTRVGRSFSLIHTFNDIDKKRKGIQKQQEEQQMLAVGPVTPNTMGAQESSGLHEEHPSPTSMGPADLPMPLSTTTPCTSPNRGMVPENPRSPALSVADASISTRSFQHTTPTSAPASTPTVRGNLANYVHALYRPQLDPNNSDERDAVMKAAEEGDLLDMLNKIDGEENPHSAAPPRHQHAGTNRIYDDHHHHHHGGMLRVKSETWTEEQILEGNLIGAPREHRLKAIANTISAQQRLATEARAEQLRLSKELRFDRQSSMLGHGSGMLASPSSVFTLPAADDSAAVINALEAAEERLSSTSGHATTGTRSPGAADVGSPSSTTTAHKSSPTSALHCQKPNFGEMVGPNAASPSAQLRMAIERSIASYIADVATKEQLTPVNNYVQLLWRDYELHWACVTQLKLILDYYVLMSVVFNWEGVRGKTAIMGLISGLLSVYRVFVYGR